LHRAEILDDLRMPPGNRLEFLKGNRQGQHSIRVSGQWRICFAWRGGKAAQVEMVDYHWRMSKRNARLAPVHPGDVLQEDFMKPLGLSAYAVAKAVGATPIAISQICRGQRAVSAIMALKLGRLFSVSPEVWMGIQADYDLEVARLGNQTEIEKNVRPLPALATAAAVGT
jgi:addiction module HigA family antidote